LRTWRLNRPFRARLTQECSHSARVASPARAGQMYRTPGLEERSQQRFPIRSHVILLSPGGGRRMDCDDGARVFRAARRERVMSRTGAVVESGGDPSRPGEGRAQHARGSAGPRTVRGKRGHVCLQRVPRFRVYPDKRTDVGSAFPAVRRSAPQALPRTAMSGLIPPGT